MKHFVLPVLLAACAMAEQRAEGPPLADWEGFAALINHSRAEAGLDPVAPEPRLAGAAGDHAADMAARQGLSHTGSDGSDILGRIAAQGYVACRAAENIAVGPRDKVTLMARWMTSPDHRANILRHGVSEFGLAREDRYWALKLAAPC